MKRRVREALRKMLGARPEIPAHSWEKPVDTLGPREHALDMAVMNLHIATRFEDGAPGGLAGDYAEFGVFEGRSFAHVARRAAGLMPRMRFFAFDSFRGLPPPKGDDAGAEFTEGQFSCTEPRFEENLRANGVDMTRVRIVPGWFDRSLVDDLKARMDLRVVSIAFIDCDLYESTVPVLRFLTGLVRQGSILLFDDWFCFRADPARGVQRATSEWLAANPRLRLVPWTPFSHHGHSFFVTIES